MHKKKAGFDAVEILGSAGYLISQFLFPTTNLPTDEYGGGWENRCRFSLEVIVERLPRIGNRFDAGCAGPVLRDPKRLKVQSYTQSRITQITDRDVVVTQSKEEAATEIRIPCDTVVLAAGRTPSTALYEALSGAGRPVHIIGDAAKVGKVLDAIHQALDLATQM